MDNNTVLTDSTPHKPHSYMYRREDLHLIVLIINLQFKSFCRSQCEHIGLVFDLNLIRNITHAV